MTVGKENSSNIEIYYKDWGSVVARGLQPWLAFERRRLGRPDVFSGLPRLPLHRARPPWTRPIESALNGNDMDTTPTTSRSLVEALDLKDAIHVGHPQHVITPVLNTEP